ncbi:MAG: restriction endonuclease [Solibacillus sp.]
MAKYKKKRKKRQIPFPIVVAIIIFLASWYYKQSIQFAISTVIVCFMLFVCFKWWMKSRKAKKIRQSDIYKVDQMTGEDFEHFLGELFKKRGYKVSYTATSGDYGADLVLKDGRDVIVVQAKRYSGSVGVKAVQEIIGAVRMYKANEAWVVTNSHFTRQAEKLAEINDVYLIDREELIKLMKKKR